MYYQGWVILPRMGSVAYTKAKVQESVLKVCAAAAREEKNFLIDIELNTKSENFVKCSSLMPFKIRQIQDPLNTRVKF